VAVTLGDADLHVEATITAKDADQGEGNGQSMNDGLDMGLKNVVKGGAGDSQGSGAARGALNTVKIAASGANDFRGGSATADAIPAGIKAIFWIGGASQETSVNPPDVRPSPLPPMKDK